MAEKEKNRDLLFEEQFDLSGLFDTHAHYFDRMFDGSADSLLKKLFDAGLDGIINIGTSNKNTATVISQAKRYEKMYAAVGIHPEDCLYSLMIPEREVELLEETILSERGSETDKIVALGEIGLDYHVENCDSDVKLLQREYFELQLALAKKLELPVVIHDREAHGDCFDTVLAHKDVVGVFHSYSGSAEMARELVKRGYYISFSGVVTFKNAARVREVAASVPIDRILIETDAPYLAPHPMRGKINHSGLMRYTAQMIADIFGKEYREMLLILRENTRRLFGV